MGRRISAHHRFRRLLSPARIYLLRATTDPISQMYGFDRGTPVDRRYIWEFIHCNRRLVAGRCLEVQSDLYSEPLRDQTTTIDILDIDPGNERANIRGDLQNLHNVPDRIYDCVLVTQVLQFLPDVAAGVGEIHRILKPG